jgi:hypothetical protein
MTRRALNFFLKLQIFKEPSYQKSWHQFNFYLKLQILWDFIFNSKYLCVKSLEPNNSGIQTEKSCIQAQFTENRAKESILWQQFRNFFRKFTEIFAAQGSPPVSLISLRIFEKICNGPNRILLGWGETADS